VSTAHVPVGDSEYSPPKKQNDFVYDDDDDDDDDDDYHEHGHKHSGNICEYRSLKAYGKGILRFTKYDSKTCHAYMRAFGSHSLT
jgi:hypothetical protein